MEAREGIEPRCLSARRFGQERFRRPLSGTRAFVGGDGEIQTLSRSITNRVLLSVELHRLKDLWPGREAAAPQLLHDPDAVTLCAGRATPRKILVADEGLEPTAS